MIIFWGACFFLRIIFLAFKSSSSARVIYRSKVSGILKLTSFSSDSNETVFIIGVILGVT